MEIKYDQFFTFKDATLNKTAKSYLDTYLKERPISIFNAEPGWSMVVSVPIPNSKEILIDIIPIKKWAVFSSMKFEDDNRINRIIISKYTDCFMPIIPDDYSGVLSSYFEDIEKNIPGWHRVPPPSIIYGCITDDDHRTREDIEAQSRKMYTDWLSELEKTEKLADDIISSLKTKQVDSNIFTVFNRKKEILN